MGLKLEIENGQTAKLNFYGILRFKNKNETQLTKRLLIYKFEFLILLMFQTSSLLLTKIL